MGSVLALTDDSQNIQTVYGYSPHGEQAQTGEPNENSLQYTGRENDNTGLYYYRARYYDASLKRFISQDPAGLRAGVNIYLYARANPLRYIDPTGLVGEEDLIYILTEKIPDIAAMVARASPYVGAFSVGFGIGSTINYACGGNCFPNLGTGIYDLAHSEPPKPPQPPKPPVPPPPSQPKPCP